MRGKWLASMALGAWLSAVAVWPAFMVPAGRAHLLWQPILWVSVAILAAIRGRRSGWAAAAGQAAFLYIMLTIAAWLPFLHTTTYVEGYVYPRAYGCYLWFYEAGLAALIGWLAGLAARGATSWWTTGGWSRPLVVAPILLLIRAWQVGHLAIPLLGVLTGFGLGLAAWRPLRTVTLPTWGRRAAPWLLAAAAGLLVFGSGVRIYRQTGADFPRASDDGDSYYGLALEVARQPSRIWTPPPFDSNFFSAYVPLMGLWFRVAGPRMPLWLAWQALAGGLLVLMVFRLGRLLGGAAVGAAAAALTAADHVLLHIMGTLNTEVFFLPALYAALWLWASVTEQPAASRLRACALAGLALGLAAVFRPTAVLMTPALIALLWIERPPLSWTRIRQEASRLVGGFALPVAAVALRNRAAWGHWTLFGGSNGSHLSWIANYAWEVQGQHPGVIGWGPWLRLVAEQPSMIWRGMIPDWWAEVRHLWSHPGFGQMDLVQGLNHGGPYQAALAVILGVALAAGAGVAVGERRRIHLVVLALPVYFTGLALVYWVINTRYRAPFIPALYLLAALGLRQLARRAGTAPLPGRPPVEAQQKLSRVAVA